MVSSVYYQDDCGNSIYLSISDGAGLACGIFEYLLGLGDERPKVLAATHFHEIFENGFLPE